MPGNRLYKYIHKWMDVGLLFLMYYLCVGGHTGALLGGAHSPGLLRVRHCYYCCHIEMFILMAFTLITLTNLTQKGSLQTAAPGLAAASQELHPGQVRLRGQDAHLREL